MSKYVYPYSRKSAMHDGALDLWQESRSENIACAKAICEEIARSCDGFPPDESPAVRVIGQFGIDRINWVLAATIQQQSKEKHFTPEDKTWAAQFTMHYLKEELPAYCVDGESIAIQDFLAQAQREYEQLNLFNPGHCLPNSADLDYRDRVLVLKPTLLGDEYKAPEHQLVVADTGGFGCSPSASGRKVMGHFLLDGEVCAFRREDFVGIIADEHLPLWAQEVLEQRRGGIEIAPTMTIE